MKTIFDKSTRCGLIERINTVTEHHSAQWGKMNVYQMLMHGIKWDQMALGKTKYRQSFFGKIFGKIALPDFIGDERPFKKNVPTVPDLKITDTSGDTSILKAKWIALIEEYDNYQNENFIHPFFGGMTKEQLGYLAYKHTDHHLRQFGA